MDLIGQIMAFFCMGGFVLVMLLAVLSSLFEKAERKKEYDELIKKVEGMDPEDKIRMIRKWETKQMLKNYKEPEWVKEMRKNYPGA